MKESRPRGLAIYHSQVTVDLLKKDREPDRATKYGNMCVSFDGENNGVQAGVYDGSKGNFTFNVYMTQQSEQARLYLLTICYC